MPATKSAGFTGGAGGACSAFSAAFWASNSVSSACMFLHSEIMSGRRSVSVCKE